MVNDPFLRDLMVDTLVYCINREVTSFDDGDTARQYFEAGGHAHIVVSDIDLPRLSGMELLSYLKSRNPEIIFIAMSDRGEHEELLKKSDADGFLIKPFEINDLFEIVQHYVID